MYIRYNCNGQTRHFDADFLERSCGFVKRAVGGQETRSERERSTDGENFERTRARATVSTESEGTELHEKLKVML